MDFYEATAKAWFDDDGDLEGAVSGDSLNGNFERWLVEALQEESAKRTAALDSEAADHEA